MGDELAAYLQEVHQPIPAYHADFGGGSVPLSDPVHRVDCRVCRTAYPCQTLRLLDPAAPMSKGRPIVTAEQWLLANA